MNCMNRPHFRNIYFHSINPRTLDSRISTMPSHERQPHGHRHQTHVTRSRSRSPRPRHVDSHRGSKRRRRSSSPSRHADNLPYNARPLEKSDLSAYRGLLGLYLDIQKGMAIEELDEKEVKGRWKSFLGKW
ncbi:hypothetical protein P152DRAFT_325043 [Eremomyces bilateralis CBS 781.70]|uniref:Uncharacterized protein n=1 Tax=Eremomyces bilateralis CBS 781.70 TaxID=1392243 RepID=A0A6G1G3W6_9PEZI|nr:uncharacterized protein P152DRAFT_325043 [Eremomyces bilateralis CBS 781.70]KAF1812753.1 hypothetical protein P152DRAFT_325043 [Eremomyces bilateralis CBS 781.70]